MAPPYWTQQAPKTISTSTAETARGTHVFDIQGYSHHRGIGNKEFLRSGTFAVGGYDWEVHFYPDDFTVGPGGQFEALDFDFVSAYLRLVTAAGAAGKARASCDVRLVDQTTGLSSSVIPNFRDTVHVFADDDRIRTCMIKLRSDVEKPPFLVDDRLIMEFVLTVRKPPRVTKTKRWFRTISVPPPGIAEQLERLLEAKEGADVEFSVAGEKFEAHKLVLAMRSPVFKAQLCGPMREAGARPVVIEDMQPDVFRELLHFIYTDWLHTHDLDGEEDGEMIRHLLVAADRYAVDRLKMVCQSILCKNLHVRNVATTLALADQHHCDKLKEACIEFMSCSNMMNDVVATQGYAHLLKTDPSVLADAMVKISSIEKNVNEQRSTS